MTKHIYRCIKVGWGIWIEIDCVAYAQTDFVGEYVTVIDKLYFSANRMTPSYSEKWATIRDDSFKQGLMLIADKFAETVNASIVIEVLGATYNLTDFQTEGYGYGIANWVIKEYNLDIELPSPVYNKAKNRYMFPYETDNMFSI